MPKDKRFQFRFDVSESAGKDEAEIMLYSQIVSYKWSKDDDSEITAAEFDKALKQAKAAGRDRLRLRINSPGGSVSQAVAMKTMVENGGFSEVNIDIEGLCASAATFFLCVPGAHVRIASGSEVMIHNPSCMEWGTAEDLEKTARRMRAMEKEQHGWYAARTGKTEEEIKAMMDATTWMTASEAVKQGFCDEVMETAEAAACLDADSWALMRECYEKVPEAPKKQVSTGKPAEHTKEGLEGKNMDIENMTAEQLKEQAPRLYEAAMQEGRKAGIADERDRMQAIDELTDEGYEDLAQKAKNEGWTESAFLKELRKAKADRKKEFLKERKGETGAAEQVLGGSQGDQDGNAEEEMKKFRKEAKEMAEELTGASSGGMC